LKSRKECIDNLHRYLKVVEISDIDYNESNIKKLLSKKLSTKVNQEYVESVFFDYELNKQQVKDFNSYGLVGVYLRNNYLYANPEEIVSIDYSASKLKGILNYTEKDIKYLLRKRKLRYIPILNKLDIHLIEYLKTYLKNEKLAIKKGILNKENSINNFFILEAKPHRYYPEGELAASVI
jgi:hypothetical protein